MGLLMCAHSDRLANVALFRQSLWGFHVGDSSSDGSATRTRIFDGEAVSFGVEDLVKRKLGDGSSVGAVGRR